MADRGCTAELEVEAPNSVAEAVNVDNRTAPPWLRVECRHDNGRVICAVHIENCREPRRILSLRNTLDDLLIALRAAVESLR